MATPILKFNVNIFNIKVSSRHRKIDLQVLKCPQTGDAITNVLNQTVAGSTEASTLKFEAFLEKLRQKPENYLGILCESFESFFGADIELYIYSCQAHKDVEVLHPDEVLLEMKSGAFMERGIDIEQAYRGTAIVVRNSGKFKSFQMNLETTIVT